MAWDKTKPTDDGLLINFPGEMRANLEALEAGTTTALKITNAKVAAAAAIVDTKLAQITTAGKVSGTAITLLTNVPSGAGAIPVANIPNMSADKITSGELPLVRGGSGAALVNDPGGILYCGASVLAILANDAGSAKFLRCGSTGAPAWDTVDIINETHSTLTIARGGTGSTTLAGAKIATVIQLSYVGNAADNRNLTGAGFNPNHAHVMYVHNDGGYWALWWKSFSSDNNNYSYTDNGASQDTIQDFITDGIQLGASNNVNGSGKNNDALLMCTATGTASG